MKKRQAKKNFKKSKVALNDLKKIKGGKLVVRQYGDTGYSERRKSR